MNAKRPGLAGLAAAFALAVIGGLGSRPSRAQTPIVCPASPSTATGRSFQGQTLSFANFSRMDLTNANFKGATLKGAMFIGANLTGADFSGATFIDSGSQARPNDFSFANLDSACFIGAKFGGTTYFTYAKLPCTDFSSTDLSTGNSVFGDSPLVVATSASCRTAFRATRMNCEFVGQWGALDLTNADISLCRQQLAGRDYSNASMAGVDFTNVLLDGTLFANANLSRAVLDRASLQCGPPAGGGAPRCVDLSNARLQGARLAGANLSGASLYGAFLSNNVNGSISDAASMRQAHLKNVNLSAAQLSGVDFTLANFYGDTPTNPSGCASSGANFSGFTKGCASAHNANMAAATFAGAYLYGVDFSAATISGASFDQAVLSGANFAGANVGTFAPSGSRTKFTRAHLEGTNLDQAATLDADLTDAFVDFRNGGNLFYALLDGTNHNSFTCSGPSACKPPAGQDVCVWVRYPQTTVPGADANLTCPDGSSAGPSGCGDASAGNTRWKSSLDAGKPPPGPPPAWYSNTPTYGSATTDPQLLCRGAKPVPLW
jgi:uncharacterized protein YjbI with pentapeptide repeats